MIDEQTINTAQASTEAVIAALRLPEPQQQAVMEVCQAVQWAVVPAEDIVLRLMEDANLDLDQAMDLFDELDDKVWPIWEEIWEKLEQQQRQYVTLDLDDQLHEWVANAGSMVEPKLEQLGSQPAWGLVLQRAIENNDTWLIYGILDRLARRGALVSTVLQGRAIHDGFVKWLAGAATGAVLPEAEQWTAPYVALLLEYLIEVVIGWGVEDAAMAAVTLCQALAHATGDQSYATIVFGSEEKNEFEWRPVRVDNGTVVFAD
jgi:hypothetical protein